MTTQLPPDYETRHTLAAALCEHLGINPEHVALGSMRIELGPDAQHRVTWTGHAHLNLPDLTRLLLKANHPHDNPDPDCTHPLRRYDGTCANCGDPYPADEPPCPNAPLCSRPARHPGQCHMP